MTAFFNLFIPVLIIVSIGLMSLLLVSRLRKKQPGCSGNHDCVTYKGEKVMCPACELNEHREDKGFPETGKTAC